VKAGEKKLDGYGLHALDCPCGWCQLGNGPTATERAAAVRAALERGQRAARVQWEKERVEEAAAKLEMFSSHMEVMREVKPLTPDEFKELQESWRSGTWKTQTE
jgi:hypothetical protein